MGDYLLYEKPLDEVQEQDWPEKGGVYIAVRRLGGWGVCIMGRAEPCGVFWILDYAKLFAEALAGLQGSGEEGG